MLSSWAPLAVHTKLRLQMAGRAQQAHSALRRRWAIIVGCGAQLRLHLVPPSAL